MLSTFDKCNGLAIRMNTDNPSERYFTSPPLQRDAGNFHSKGFASPVGSMKSSPVSTMISSLMKTIQ